MIYDPEHGVKAGAGCMQGEVGGEWIGAVCMSAGIFDIQVQTGDGNDQAELMGEFTIPVEIDLGAGDDVFTAESGGGRMVIFGGSGADEIASGSGADLIDPGAGEDIVDAGAGDDVIAAADDLGLPRL